MTSDERYTNPRYYPAIEAVLGGIGLDPTSNPQKSVPARHHLTEQDDCLTTDWTPYLLELPTVYKNPPFSNSFPFLRRLAEYLRSGQVQIAITLTLQGALCNKKTQHLFSELAVAVIHPHGRIQFIGSNDRNDRDVVWTLWGRGATEETIELFAEHFEGLCLRVKR